MNVFVLVIQGIGIYYVIHATINHDGKKNDRERVYILAILLLSILGGI